MALAREIGHFGTLAIALMYASAQHLGGGEAETAAGEFGGRARESLRGAWPRGVHRRGWFLQSWVRVEQSHSEDGIGGMGHAFKQIARINLMRDMFVDRMAECLRRAGQTEDASWLTRH